MSSMPAPWIQYRDMAERIGNGVEDAVSHVTGTRVDLGLVSSCDPDELVSDRPYPLRAIVVRFNRPLRDVMVFISSLREDVVRPLAEAAAAATLEMLEIEQGSDRHGPYGQFTIEEGVEFEELETALEQCDGLYLEAMYDMSLPTGELHLVLGTGLIESAYYCARGERDPYAVERPIELEIVGAVPGSDASRYQFGDGSIMDGADADALGVVAAASPGSVLDALDAQLAADAAQDLQLQAAQAADAAGAGAGAAVAAGPGAAGVSASHAGQVRWTQLLSGVEVELSAELGRTELTLQDITSLDSDSVLTLDQLVDEPVTMYVNGTAYATARLVVVDGEYGVEVLEILDQAALAPAQLAA